VAVLDQLRAVGLFQDLSQRQLRQLARLVKERAFRPRTVVVEEGTMSGAKRRPQSRPYIDMDAPCVQAWLAPRDRGTRQHHLKGHSS
jgi:hypothetical protein